MTMMRELLFVLDVNMMRECDVGGNAGVGGGGAVIAGHEYVVGGTRGSGIVSSATELWCV